MYMNRSIYSTCHIHRTKFPAASYHPGYAYFPGGGGGGGGEGN